MVAKSLLIKGIGGLAAAGGVLGGGFLLKKHFSKEEPNTLMEKLGLSCGGLENIGEEGVQCSISGSLNVKKDDKTSFELANIVSSSGKIKVYKYGGYNQGFRFEIEEGDIVVPNDNNNNKLEEFESYEVDGENDGYILSLKEKSWEKKRRILGLSGCNFPEDTGSTTTCEIKNINSINFEGKGNATVSGAGSLKIEVVQPSDATDFPYGFKFTLTPSSDITQGGTTKFKSGKETELKIKKTNNKTLTLEKAWNLETLSKMVGLSCSGDTCSIGGNVNLSVKQEDNFETNLTISSVSGQGQMKVVNDDDYEHGLKFQIENGNINLNDSSTTINILEEYDTYEIKKEEAGGWYLTRKVKGMEKKKTLITLPDGCNLPSGNDEESCVLDTAKINQIKFDGKVGSSITIEESHTTKLKISKTTDDNFPMGYRFVLESDKDITFNSTTSETIKANTNTEFKIKKTGSGNDIVLTLERAWDVISLGKKIGLTCTANSSECTLGERINVRETDSSFSENAQVSGTNKKIIFEKDQEGYNQGFKFKVEADIDLTGGTNSTGSPVNKIKKCDDATNEEESYEIVEKSSSDYRSKIWYLAKKWNVDSLE